MTEVIVVDDGSTDGTWEWLQAQDDIVFLARITLDGKTGLLDRPISYSYPAKCVFRLGLMALSSWVHRHVA